MKKKNILISILVIIPFIALFIFYYFFMFSVKFKYFADRIAPQVQACIEHNQKVFIDSLEGKDILPQNETQALEIIRQIDLNKLTLNEDAQLAEFLVTNCTSYNIKKFLELDRARPTCRKIFDQYNFFKAVVNSLKKYSWSKRTKDEMERSIYSFIKMQVDKKNSLQNLMVSSSILKLLLEENQINRKHRKIISGSFTGIERNALMLRSAYRKLQNPDGSIDCDNFIKYKTIEQELINTSAQKLQAVLDVISE